jgi:hypothetical protein
MKRHAHSMPESARALWRIVSLTAAKTSRMFEVSVACVRLRNQSVSSLRNRQTLVLARARVGCPAFNKQTPVDATSCMRCHLHPAGQAERRGGILTAGISSNAPC